MSAIHLDVPIEGRVMQCRAAGAVRYVDIGEQRYQVLSTLHRVVGGRHMQGCLPVFVARIHISRVT